MRISLGDEKSTPLPKTIVLQHLDEYVGVYKGYKQDFSRFVIRCDDCQIVFSTDGLQEPESLADTLSNIPVGRRIGIFMIREETRSRIVFRLID